METTGTEGSCLLILHCEYYCFSHPMYLVAKIKWELFIKLYSDPWIVLEKKCFFTSIGLQNLVLDKGFTLSFQHRPLTAGGH